MKKYTKFSKVSDEELRNIAYTLCLIEDLINEDSYVDDYMPSIKRVVNEYREKVDEELENRPYYD